MKLALPCSSASRLALLMHWPLPLHIGSDVPKDLGDPLPQAWQIAWGGHALQHQPFDYWQSNMYWPLENSLAFSDALVGYAPFGLIGEGFEAAIVRYDLLFLFAYALAFVGAYLLARELGIGRAGRPRSPASRSRTRPWRLEQDGHMHVISSGGIPLALFLLVRGYRRGSAGTIIAGWLVATWQLALGFTLGLMLAYLLAALAVALLFVPGGAGDPPRASSRPAWPARSCLRRSRACCSRCPTWRCVTTIRSRSARRRRSPPSRAALRCSSPRPTRAPSGVRSREPVREELDFVPEQTLFPGLLVVLLAGIGPLAGVAASEAVTDRAGYRGASR